MRNFGASSAPGIIVLWVGLQDTSLTSRSHVTPCHKGSSMSELELGDEDAE